MSGPPPSTHFERRLGLKGVELTIEVADGRAEVDIEENGDSSPESDGDAPVHASDGGRLSVTAAIDGGDAVFEVIDFGAGIAPDELPEVFERFYRSTHSRTSGTEGSGLGLYIVRRIAELHGGNATAESRIGEGSTFRIRFPTSL